MTCSARAGQRPRMGEGHDADQDIFRSQKPERDHHASHLTQGHQPVDLASGPGTDLDRPQGPARHHPDSDRLIRLSPVGVHHRRTEIWPADE